MASWMEGLYQTPVSTLLLLRNSIFFCPLKGDCPPNAKCLKRDVTLLPCVHILPELLSQIYMKEFSLLWCFVFCKFLINDHNFDSLKWWRGAASVTIDPSMVKYLNSNTIFRYWTGNNDDSFSFIQLMPIVTVSVFYTFTEHKSF